MSEYIAKAPIEPRDYRVVFLIQKEKEPHYTVPFPAHKASFPFEAGICHAFPLTSFCGCCYISSF